MNLIFGFPRCLLHVNSDSNILLPRIPVSLLCTCPNHLKVAALAQASKLPVHAVPPMSSSLSLCILVIAFPIKYTLHQSPAFTCHVDHSALLCAESKGNEESRFCWLDWQTIWLRSLPQWCKTIRSTGVRLGKHQKKENSNHTMQLDFVLDLSCAGPKYHISRFKSF